ncbi:NAD(P)H-dependent oxidoreductase [Streptomyces roseirectus]|uniref:NAD(P)H-dependent oxidoreductase n=1 Tax=Streptomyces roseirectus TaxID=2768066 RepID=A0A7H0IBN9_9ACTN|nr:NADPH-dependent FMN reductase [Streptomyces roseirectus]QNP70205.1 NAD(P)H-dependent oxidoreductase [Streptomyces roseirectus]
MSGIVLMSGSVRGGSYNSAVVATVRRIVAERFGGVWTEVLDAGELPFYDEDLDAVDGSEAVVRMRERVRAADVVLLSTPSYNGAASGVLKNAVDWLSRPYGESALDDRITVVTSASPGPRGAVDAQAGLVEVLGHAGALVVEHPPVAVAHAEELITTQGEFEDPRVLAELESLVRAALDAAGWGAAGQDAAGQGSAEQGSASLAV